MPHRGLRCGRARKREREGREHFDARRGGAGAGGADCGLRDRGRCGAAGVDPRRRAGIARAVRDGGGLAAPQLTLCNQAGNILRKAAGWTAEANAEEIRDAAARTGAFTLADGSQDSAMVTTLLPGIYTVQVSGVGEARGVAMVEVYDLP